MGNTAAATGHRWSRVVVACIVAAQPASAFAQQYDNVAYTHSERARPSTVDVQQRIDRLRRLKELARTDLQDGRWIARGNTVDAFAELTPEQLAVARERLGATTRQDPAPQQLIDQRMYAYDRALAYAQQELLIVSREPSPQDVNKATQRSVLLDAPSEDQLDADPALCMRLSAYANGALIEARQRLLIKLNRTQGTLEQVKRVRHLVDSDVQPLNAQSEHALLVSELNTTARMLEHSIPAMLAVRADNGEQTATLSVIASGADFTLSPVSSERAALRTQLRAPLQNVVNAGVALREIATELDAQSPAPNRKGLRALLQAKLDAAATAVTAFQTAVRNADRDLLDVTQRQAEINDVTHSRCEYIEEIADTRH